MSFISKWSKSDKPGFAERMKRTLRPAPGLKSRVEQAQRKLQVQMSRLDSVSTKLRERDQMMFRKIVLAVQQHDMEYSTVLSNELSQIRKINKIVNHARMALEQIQIRMGTITELGDVVVTLNPAMAIVKDVRAGIAGMMPEVDNNMQEISQLVSGILIESGQVPNNTVDVAQYASTTDAQDILNEAASIMECQIKDKLPDLPMATQKRRILENTADKELFT